mgnify:CR=1 FL=1
MYELIPDLNPRWLGLRLLDGDKSILESMNEYITFDYNEELEEIKNKLPKINSIKNIKRWIYKNKLRHS